MLFAVSAADRKKTRQILLQKPHDGDMSSAAPVLDNELCGQRLGKDYNNLDLGEDWDYVLCKSSTQGRRAYNSPMSEERRGQKGDPLHERALWENLGLGFTHTHTQGLMYEAHVTLLIFDGI